MADHESISKLAESLVRELALRGKAVATAESCTGGWIAKAITDIPGSSEVFGYGIVCYSNGAKESQLGVRTETIARHGSVSEPVVREMAEGVLKLSGADLAVAVSGVAGPGGGSPEKPVGMVWFAWAVRSRGKIRIETQLERFTGDREFVRERSVLHALQGLQARIGP